MSHQHPNAPFPFDAMDPFEDLGGAEYFPSAASLGASSRSVGDPRAAIAEIRRALSELDRQIQSLLTLLDRELHAISTSAARSDVTSSPALGMTAAPSALRPSVLPSPDAGPLVRTIEGVFDGQYMIGPDGKRYSVPANYASKSKLVEGDILKLSITGRGAFVYKQIVPIPRERVVGILTSDDVSHEHIVLVADHEGDRAALARAILERTDLPSVPHKRYRILRASVTFYRGESGDEVVVLIPKGSPATWAAVENIIKR